MERRNYRSLMIDVETVRIKEFVKKIIEKERIPITCLECPFATLQILACSNSVDCYTCISYDECYNDNMYFCGLLQDQIPNQIPKCKMVDFSLLFIGDY